MLIDLSIKLDGTTPTYPGDPEIMFTPAGSVEADGYALHTLTCGTHSGTHIDAPAHMIAGGAPLDALPLDTFMGDAVLIEGFSMEAVLAAGLRHGDIAVFYTGASERLYEEDYFTASPAMDTAVAEYLVQAGVKLVCLDTPSADTAANFPIHNILLGAGIPIAENLVNVAALRGKQFSIIALPLRLGADGAPARIVAEVQD